MSIHFFAPKIGWSCNEFLIARRNPAARTEDLASGDLKLADKRADAIKDFLKRKDVGADVDTYNMAKHPGWISRTFKTDESFLKQALPKSKATTREDLALEYFGKILREKAGPSTAAVIVRGAGETAAH